MKISFNPSNSNKNILDLIKNNKDIIFDLKGHSIFARGVEFKGTDTNTWRDIKINNVSIGSHTLDLRNGSNTTLTNTNGVVTINSTWRPVVDNLTSDSTTSSLSAKQGKVLKALIDGKSNSDHNHDGRYLRLTGGWMSGDINFGGDNKIYWGRNTDSASISFKNDEDANSYMSFVTSDNGNEYFRWSHSSGSTNTEWMALRSDGLRVRGTKVSLEGHSHNDLYYTKVESNAKYITDITTSVNKLTFTKNGSNITRNITVNVVYNQGNLTNIPNKDTTTKASPGLFIYNSYNQVIGANSYSSVLSINTGGTIQIAGNWGDDQTRNLYWRSQSDRNVANYPWKSWRTILDSENYSSTLDSRYYTESEVNSLLDAKLNRQNLSYGTWNPRGYHLAADYHYNGGDVSISENNGKMYVSVDGCFWQNEGQYRVLDTSDIGNIRDSVALHQYLSATDAAWYPLVWGGASHNITRYSTGPIYKSYDKLCWQTSSQTLYATNIQTNNIKNLSIGGGIYWNPNVESASDGSDAASITLVRSGVAGGTTLVLSQMNDTNDTIQFKTNTAARLYHNSYPILTTQNTYVSNNKGYINGTEITQVNNSDKVDNRHAISTTPNTGIIYKAAIYTNYSLTSYWVRLASIPSIDKNDEFIATIHVQSGHYNPGRSAILLVYLRGDASSFISKSFKICCNSNYNPNRFRLYYKDSDKTSEIWYQTTGQWDGIITTVISQSAEGQLYEGLTLYSGSITAVQTPSVSTYLSAQVSTITDNISGNASTATKLQTARSIWGQSFDGTRDVSGSLSEVGNIHFKVEDGSDAASITLVRSGVAGGTTLVLSQMNDTNDTIQFKTNTAARLYHNSYPILTTQNTYVSNNKGYINGTEITQVNNSDKVDNRHAISTTPNTGIIYKAAIYTNYSLTSYWVRLASIPSIDKNDEFIATIHVQSGHYNPGRSAILLVYLRGDASSFISKSFKICCNSNYNPNRFRLYYKDSDKTSEIWYQTTGQWDGIITTVISQSAEGQLYEGLTLYSGSITAVQTPSVSTYLSAQVSTITDNISGNASTATKLQTARSIWGQSFDGTRDVSGSLSEVGNIHFKVDNSYDIGSDAAASRYIYTHWLGAKSGSKLELGANDSGYGKGLCIDTNLNVGIGTNSPVYKLHVNGTFRATNSTVSDLFVNTGDATLKIYTGITADAQNDGNICFQTSIDATDGQSHAYPTEFQNRCNIVLQPRGGQVYIGTNPGIGNTTYKLYVNSKIFSNGGFVKNGSSDSYVLLGGGGHTLLSSLNESHNHDGRYVRAFGTSNDNIDSDWGQSFKTFDPIPSGTPPEQNPNISILNIGENFNRRKQLAFIWSNDNIYYRRHINSSFTDWRRLAFANEIPTSLPANGGNADTVDNEHASNFSYTHQSSFDFSKRKSGRIVTFDQSNTDYGWINGFASTYDDYLTSVIFNTHRTSNWYVGYMEGNMSTGETNGLQEVHKLAFADGDESYPIFLGYLHLFNGDDGTIPSFFSCLGYSVPFTYTRGGAYCLINIPNTPFQTFYIRAAIASVHYSGAGMGDLVGNHRGDGAWWLYCDAAGNNAVQVKGFHPANPNNDSWWGGNPLYSGNGAAKIITVCLFGHVKFR